ncbi:hypothetical protein DPMN_130120 [Dreissena polymorpha]|uniref:Uncharacterized protein n=2 Tax=Dreissena polymorpha TaxID=45954 RepID=A0A9D4HAE1_DREPO|nr:hypothetical protein DPMN_130120 [Dreissena polymorpha]
MIYNKISNSEQHNNYYIKIIMQYFVFLVGMLVASFRSSTQQYTGINVNSAWLCGRGETFAVNASSVFRLVGVASDSSVTCKMHFSATGDSNGCNGLCYMFQFYNVINDAGVQFNIEAASISETFTNNSVIPARLPRCSDATTLNISLKLAPGFSYVYSNKTLQYKLRIDVFHKCGALGTMKSQKYSHAFLIEAGHMTKEQFDAAERATFSDGVAVGCAFAGSFIFIMLAGIFYTRYMK